MPTAQATTYVDIFGVVSKVTISHSPSFPSNTASASNRPQSFPAKKSWDKTVDEMKPPAERTRATSEELESEVRPSWVMREMEKVAFLAGWSKHGWMEQKSSQRRRGSRRTNKCTASVGRLEMCDRVAHTLVFVLGWVQNLVVPLVRKQISTPFQPKETLRRTHRTCFRRSSHFPTSRPLLPLRPRYPKQTPT